MMQMKKRTLSLQKMGLMPFSKNEISLLRPAINEWRPKKKVHYILTYVLTLLHTRVFLNHSYVCVKSHSQALIHMLNAIAVHMTYTEYLH